MAAIFKISSLLKFSCLYQATGMDFGTTNSSIGVARDAHTTETVQFHTERISSGSEFTSVAKGLALRACR